ncbi:methylated-DNA--[protein]-cysteine S-methyltransferase [Paenibacillus sp. R14(2021)]|uniref:methylated-DNA--[protein]-cysteine S-methyltransferase n=1 Tax=Paenibacillus sp. R14(2021) TaxID=2859228 RepID=UPI001C616B18|nr:methylated-DNA--[protein]-cysteine S-methyltransferase [Paenibacillus sp. R14(2021)]
MNRLYWTLVEEGGWRLYLAATDEGLCYVGSPNAPFEELGHWQAKQLPKAELMRNDAVMERYAAELRAYLDGRLQTFNVPLDLRGTSFQQSVWQALLRVPHGETSSYSAIAEQLGKEKAVRAVGMAIGANPVLIVVPCHRIIGKNGSMTGYRGGMEAKASLLALEGSLQVTR